MNEEMDPRLALPQPLMPAAGYTYLGQFIDHDMTSDPRLFGAPPAGASVENLSTPWFDLDSVYGTEPSGRDRHLYEDGEGDRLRLNKSQLDFERRADDSAVVRDRRNDSNSIVSQMHVAFVRFHNKVVDQLPIDNKRLNQAQRIVRQHYQWIVLHDFLPKMVGQDMVDSIWRNAPGGKPDLRLIEPGPEAQIPLEFSASAFRFGHSMVRREYDMNAASGPVLTFDRGQPDGSTARDLRGFRTLPDSLVIDWRMFFQGPDHRVEPQSARPIDTFLALPLFELPFEIADHRSAPGRRLPYRNLHRSEFDLGLASGQQVAQEMCRRNVPGVESKILGTDVRITAAGALAGDRDIGGTGIGKAVLEERLNEDAPLWYYILKEAEHFHHGARLGTVGGRIVAEVIIGMMVSDPNSILNSKWTPKAGEFECQQNGEYGFVDFLAYSGVAWRR